MRSVIPVLLGFSMFPGCGPDSARTPADEDDATVDIGQDDVADTADPDAADPDTADPDTADVSVEPPVCGSDLGCDSPRAVPIGTAPVDDDWLTVSSAACSGCTVHFIAKTRIDGSGAWIPFVPEEGERFGPVRAGHVDFVDADGVARLFLGVPQQNAHLWFEDGRWHVEDLGELPRPSQIVPVRGGAGAEIVAVRTDPWSVEPYVIYHSVRLVDGWAVRELMVGAGSRVDVAGAATGPDGALWLLTRELADWTAWTERDGELHSRAQFARKHTPVSEVVAVNGRMYVVTVTDDEQTGTSSVHVRSFTESGTGPSTELASEVCDSTIEDDHLIFCDTHASLAATPDGGVVATWAFDRYTVGTAVLGDDGVWTPVAFDSPPRGPLHAIPCGNTVRLVGIEGTGERSLNEYEIDCVR